MGVGPVRRIDGKSRARLDRQGQPPDLNFTLDNAPQTRKGFLRVGDVELTLLRPVSPEELIDEVAFERDEFLPYWAELWPAAMALASALPVRLDGVSVVEVGSGLGVRRWSPPRAGRR